MSSSGGSGVQRATAVLYGVACHALFVAAVGTMMVTMYFGMNGSFGGVAWPWSVLTNALLLAQFPLAHSLLLTPFGMSVLKRLAPATIAPRMATTTYVIVASIQVLLLFLLWTPSGVAWWHADGPSLWILTAFYAASWLLLGKAIWDAGFALQTGLLGWWAVASERKPLFPPMPTGGLFRLMRQPIYVAFALTLWTVPTWTPDQLVVALALTAYCVIGPLLKEHRFERRFGEAFLQYAKRVPYWLPWPRPPQTRNDLSIYDASADWWSGNARWLRTLHNLVHPRFAFFDTVVTDWRGAKVLDVGCGGGYMAEALAKRGAIVSAVDPSEGAIAAARRHAEAAGLRIDYGNAGGESLPFAAGVFDIVVCVDVLEHVSDVRRVLAEIRRVLRPGGLFLFDTINRTWLASFVLVTLGEDVLRIGPRGLHDPARFIRPGELANLLTAERLEVGRFVGMGPVGLNWRLDFIFGRVPTMAIQYLGWAEASVQPAP